MTAINTPMVVAMSILRSALLLPPSKSRSNQEAGTEVGVVDLRIVVSFEPTDLVAQEVFLESVLRGHVRVHTSLDIAYTDSHSGGAQTGPMELSACGCGVGML